MKKVAFITLGCKVNQYETNSMIQQFLQKGYEIVETTEKADIYIVNTCTVTNISDRKSRQMLRRVKEINPEAMVVACGCYVQVAKEAVQNIVDVDLAVGNNEKKEIIEIIEHYQKEKTKKTKISDLWQQEEYIEMGETTYTDKTRSVVKIQDGCDRFCSYCIIPYARGRVRSRKPDHVIKEIKKMAQKGIQEVVITGIHIASYGKDFQHHYRLIDLLEQINSIEGIKRIRLGSIEPLLITEEFIERLSKLEKICHQFHLSLQSGCDDTLKRMNRQYSIKDIKIIVERLRQYDPEVILTTDIIVGFPQESQEEFERTYTFLQNIKFYKMHVFKYSPRKGTKAEQMEGQVDGKIKEERSKQLLELSNKNEKEYNQRYIDQEVEVLWEEKKHGYYQGHTKNYILAFIKSEEDLVNKITKAKCIGAERDHILLLAKSCNENVIET